FLFTLQVDVERVGRSILMSDQRLATPRVHDLVEHEIGAVGFGLVGKVDPCLQPDIDAARNNPERNVRRLRLAVGSGNTTGFYRFECVGAVSLRRLTAPAAEP